jgi:formate-nitrite transporter family protein
MSKMAKPLIIIVIAVIIAGGAAMVLTKQSSGTAESSTAGSGTVPKGGGRFRGPENAPITLMEFGDFQCPTCGVYAPMVLEVLKRFPTQVRLEFHHFPLVQLHPNAMNAALAAESAGDQGHYWEMHDMIFAHQEDWSRLQNAESQFMVYAGQLGLNVNQFMQSMRAPDVQSRVLQDVVRARDANINSVPTFYINGEKIQNPANVDEFSKVLQEHLPKQ